MQSVLRRVNPLRLVEIGFRNCVQIPEAWTVFIYRGFVYELRDDRFICTRPYVPKP